MEDLRGKSDGQLVEEAAFYSSLATARLNELSRRKRASSESSTSSSSFCVPSPLPSPKVGRLEDPESGGSDTDIKVDIETRRNKGPIIVRRTVKCSETKPCKLCPYVFSGDRIENKMYPNRPLMFKEGTPFTCSNIEEGDYILTCGNPICPKYHTVIYIGQSGGGKKGFLKIRMLDHVDRPNPVGVDSHFTGPCKGYMRFVYLKEIKDLNKRLKKETVYMHRFGTLHPAIGYNSQSLSPHPKQPIIRSGDIIPVKTFAPGGARANVPEMRWQVLAAKYMLEQPERKATPVQIAMYVEDNYPGYSAKFANFRMYFGRFLSLAIKKPEEEGAIPPTSTNYSDWFTQEVKGGPYQLKDDPKIKKTVDDSKDLLALYAKKVTTEVKTPPPSSSSSSRPARGARKYYSESDNLTDDDNSD